MAQSSNYKLYNRQTRTLTEETSFSGGMMWTGNNIDEIHLKTIVNFNYDDTTGFLKTRNPLKTMYLGDTPLQFVENVTDIEGTLIEITEQIEGLYEKQLIGAYNMCYTDIAADNALSKAGWLYLFGDVNNVGDHYTCQEDSLVWLYLDDSECWHTVHVLEEQLNGRLVGTTGIKPILYDNALYCTNSDTQQAFYAYRIFKTQASVIDGGVVEFYVHKQSFGDNFEDSYKSAFEDDAKTLIDTVTLLEATVTGFNGLRGPEAYTYPSTEDTSPENTGTKRISGVYFKDTSGAMCVTPRLGQNIKLHVILKNVPSSDTKGIVVLSRLSQGTLDDANAVWEVLQTQDASMNVVFDCVITDETETYNIVWLSGSDENATRYDGLIHTCTTNKLNSQLRLKEYALPTARGSCLWKSHLVLWDVEGSTNCLFISETDNFYYMPIPNNVALFETDIISCIPYMGDLLVFTADRVYRLIEGNDGSFAQEVVQNNMPLAREDAAYVRAIKNMVFFKSGKYYYMIVPKAQSLTGELTVAPIYKNLAGWFDDPTTATKAILSQLYPENQYVIPDDNENQDAVTVSLPVDIYVEQDTVSILYDVSARWTTTEKIDPASDNHVYQTTDAFTQRFTLFVNYNTSLRAWTLYLEDTTQARLYPAALTAARIMSFVRVTEEGYMYLSTMQESSDPSDGVRCLIDTGYRTLANALKKRFREVQIKLYSPTENITSFGSAFFVDGVTRCNYTHLEEVSIAGAPGYVSLAPVYDPNTFLIEASVPITAQGDTAITDVVLNTQRLGSDSIELSSRTISNWSLDFSHFKRGAPATVRVPVSGKGYAPRFVFMSPKCIALHLNEINWVYRIMNGR